MLKMRSFTVSEVNQYIKRILTADPLLRLMIVEGEISNLTKHSSGHYYFTLKDDGGKLSCVMFAAQTQALTFKVENGDKVSVKGQISLYEKDGRYQLYVQDMEKQGVGALHIAFEKLKLELKNAGWFDPSHKRRLPQYPKKIGVISSPTGAAIEDIIAVYKRRSPLSTLVLYPVRVQGAFSKDEIVGAFEYFNQRDDIELIILARGGGSIEELWSFNERVVAEAVYTSKHPVITGVGHEIDTTIVDFIADVRAATPSAAAEMAIKSSQELSLKLEAMIKHMAHGVEQKLTVSAHKLVAASPIEMAKRYASGIVQEQNALMRTREKMVQTMNQSLQYQKQWLEANGRHLSSLSPLNTLERGYAIVKKDSEAQSTSFGIVVGDTVEIQMKDGVITAEVKQVVKSANQTSDVLKFE